MQIKGPKARITQGIGSVHELIRIYNAPVERSVEVVGWHTDTGCLEVPNMVKIPYIDI